MRIADLKKARRYVRSNHRPKSFPISLILLQTGKTVGEYGIRINKETEYLVDDGWIENELHKVGIKERNLHWIKEHEILKRECWTKDLQEALEKKHKAKTAQNELQKVEINSQGKMAFDTTTMMFKVTADGNEVTLISDFKGNLLNPESKHKTVTDYLAELTREFGNDKVSFQYQYQ